MAFTHLLSPMKVGNRVYKNRIVSAPMAFSLDGTESDGSRGFLSKIGRTRKRRKCLCHSW